MINAELYRVFYTVGQCGNISEASKQLFVSQPAVSKSIKKLEELSGCILFFRNSKGVILTTEGTILFDYVKQGFDHLDNGERILNKIRVKEAGIVRIGISTTLCKHILIPHLKEFHTRFPQIKINIINRTSNETLLLLEKGDIDFCIISLPEKDERLDFYVLTTITDILVANASYNNLPKQIPLHSIQKLPLMVLEKGNVTRTYIDKHFSQHGISLQPEIEISSMDFLIDFAKIGIGIALVIKKIIEKELREGTLCQIKMTPPIPSRQVGIVRQKKLPLSIAAKSCIDLLIDNFTTNQ